MGEAQRGVKRIAVAPKRLLMVKDPSLPCGHLSLKGREVYDG